MSLAVVFAVIYSEVVRICQMRTTAGALHRFVISSNTSRCLNLIAARKKVKLICTTSLYITVVAMWRSYSAKRHTCMSVARCKACSGQIGVSVRVAIEKWETFKYNFTSANTTANNIFRDLPCSLFLRRSALTVKPWMKA